MVVGQEKTIYECAISLDAAKAYENSLVSTIFRSWAPQLAEAAGIQPDQEVLEVACGTGVLARYIQKHYQARVTALDFHQAMLTVAASDAPDVHWDQGRPELLPYNNNSFDAVVSQLGLSFIQDLDDVVKEMIRVVRPGRSIALAVWDQAEDVPAYLAFRDLVSEHFGKALVSKLRQPFNLENKEKLLSLFLHPGLHLPEITNLAADLSFPSVRAWISSQLSGWLLPNLVSESDLAGFIPLAEKKLAHFSRSSGKVELQMFAHCLTSVKEQLD